MNEIKIVMEGIRELTEAVNRIATALSGGGQVQISAGAVLPPGMNAPLQQAPVSPAVPITAPPVPPVPAPVPAQGGVPTTGAVQPYTLEQLQVAAAGLTSAGKMPQVMGILQAFGIQAMTELPKERYGEFAAALRGAGAQI